jgi:hypothetical protein
MKNAVHLMRCAKVRMSWIPALALACFGGSGGRWRVRFYWSGAEDFWLGQSCVWRRQESHHGRRVCLCGNLHDERWIDCAHATQR